MGESKLAKNSDKKKIEISDSRTTIQDNQTGVQRISWKEMLINFNGKEFEEDEDMEENDLRSKDKEEGNFSLSPKQNSKEKLDDPTCLVIQVTKEEKVELYKPWKLSLIVKLLGKR